MLVSDSQTELRNCPASQHHSWLPVLVCAASLGLLLIIASTLLYGKTGFEKTLTALTFPIQFAWLLLSGWSINSLALVLRKKITWGRLRAPVVLWTLFSVSGFPFLGDACTAYLESLEPVFNSRSDPPLELLVVLGGSTSQGPDRAEVSESGDRVLLAAQLYHQGRVQRLITTGSDLLSGMEMQTSPAEQTFEIWTKLGIPPEDIEMLPGINTYAELQSLKQRLNSADSNDRLARIGLLTSAWHLPRAMRLARAAGLKQLVPVAADHKQRLAPHMFWDYIPSAKNLLRLERCQRELMARWVSR